uniref:Uncharacterized protein n=1 Tax=Janibacter limosus TaxID=53458 RepID=A0AC61U243_9MICO|nr:hypothetical protein [Janibacter limosus]
MSDYSGRHRPPTRAERRAIERRSRLPKSFGPAYLVPTAAAATPVLTAAGATAAQSASFGGSAGTQAKAAFLTADKDNGATSLLSDPTLGDDAREEVAASAQESSGLATRRQAVSASVAKDRGPHAGAQARRPRQGTHGDRRGQEEAGEVLDGCSRVRRLLHGAGRAAGCASGRPELGQAARQRRLHLPLRPPLGQAARRTGLRRRDRHAPEGPEQRHGHRRRPDERLRHLHRHQVLGRHRRPLRPHELVQRQRRPAGRPGRRRRPVGQHRPLHRTPPPHGDPPPVAAARSTRRAGSPSAASADPRLRRRRGPDERSLVGPPSSALPWGNARLVRAFRGGRSAAAAA